MTWGRGGSGVLGRGVCSSVFGSRSSRVWLSKSSVCGCAGAEEEDLGIAGSMGLTAAGAWWGCWVAVTGQGPALLAPAVPEED